LVKIVADKEQHELNCAQLCWGVEELLWIPLWDWMFHNRCNSYTWNATM